MAGTPKRITLPRIDTGSWLQQVEEESVETRLMRAISEVLDIHPDDIELFDSFTDLGGDQRSAMALRKACMTVGMAVKTKDILGCQTLAELQTRITPCARQSIFEPTLDSAMAVAPLRIPAVNRLAGSRRNGHSRNSSMSTSTTGSEMKNEAEEFLDTSILVHRSAVIKPRAGLLEGKLVAIVTLTNLPVKETRSSRVQLIPQFQMFFAGTQVASVRQSLETSYICHDQPDTWAVLEDMPLNESGEADRRELRTWIQNVNEDQYRQIMSIDTRETLQAPASEMERSLQRLVARVLPVPQAQIGMNFTFAQLGGDELAAMQLVARAKLESIYLNANEILQRNSVAQLASIASQRGGLAHKWSDESFERFALAPMQQLYFQTAMGGDATRRSAKDGAYRFNQSLLLKVKKTFTLDDICAAVQTVVSHHSMLRARFTRTVGGWTQRILPDVEGSYALHHHAVSTDKDLIAIIDRTQTSIDIENGPVFAVDHFSTSDGHQMIFIIAHHLIVDLLSWRIIIQDLDELLENGSLLSQRSMPFQKWNELQKEDVQSIDASQLDIPAGPGDYRYWGLHDAPNTYGDVTEVGFCLGEELTSLLQTACNQVFQTDSADVYLAALLLSFSQTFQDRPVPVVWNQEHGRQPWSSDIDISETVGWFTTMCPINQKVESSDDFVEVLRRLKDTRRSGPASGSQYFASKFFNLDTPDLFTNDWPLEVIFSYAGSLQQLERGNGILEQLTIPGRTLASATSDIGPKVGRVALFEVSAMVNRGAATVKILYNRYSRHQGLIQTWIHNYEHLLLEAIGRLRYHTPELTLADVPYLDVTYNGLAKLNKERVVAMNLSSVRNIETVYPVTATQQSILISQSQTPASCHFHAVYDFAAPNGEQIDVARICSAWEHVVAKHAALRTVFIDSVTETGLHDQVILRKASPNMLFIDAHPGEDPTESLTNLPAVPSSLTQPQHRLAVCRTPTKTLIKLDMSAALCDSLSLNTVIADLRRAYATEKALPEPTGLSYPGYIEFLSTARSSESLDFWRERLSGALPCAFPHLAVKQVKSQYERAFLDLEITTSDVIEFGRSNRVAPDAVFRLAWGLVLRAFSGSNDVCFGYRASGREAASGGPSMRGAVGCFANTVVCNLDMSPYKSLATVLRSTDELYVASLPHQHIAVAEIQHALGVRGGEGLFNSILSSAGESSDLNSKFTTRANLEIRTVSSFETSPYDVSVNARFVNGKLVIDIGSSIMLASQAHSLANTFGKAIEAILSAPNGSIGGVDLFTDRDFAQIVNWGNEAGVEHKVDVLHGLVAKSATSLPDAPAVCAWDGELTYRQLEQYSTMLAHHLAEAGVGPHVTVPVVLEKSMWAPVVMLAVMKAGGAFVPVDSEHLGMLQPISEQLNAGIAIGCQSSAGALSNLFEKVVIVSTALMEKFRLPERTWSSLVTADDLACVFFTPVSSKEVKGLAFTHAALTTAMSAQGPAASITSTSRVLQLSSFNVDIALAEVFTTLVAGGCVCIPTSADRVLDYTGIVQKMSVNWSYMTPVLSRKLNVDHLPTLKTVCFRTRTLDEDSWVPWAGKKKVLFAYGTPDICPLGISFLEVFDSQQLNRIGQPLVGSFWVVNPEDHRGLMPISTIGELVIEGPTLACDFSHGQVDMTHWNTAEFNAGKKSKYFKTGHLVRYTESGCLQLVSSHKEDLEIDGKTIVLAEIEQHLRKCLGQGIDVMVEAIAFKGKKVAPTLAAFIELGNLFDGSEELTRLSTITRERLFIAKMLIERALGNTLPAYKLPQIFIPIKHLPMTASLKVNRRQLQKQIHGLSREQLVALSAVVNPAEVKTIGLKPLPLTQSEEHMRSIWARVIGVEETSICAADGFLRAGGDDVLAGNLVSTCRAEGITISIGDVLRNATLADLCRSMTTTEEMRTPPNGLTSPVSSSSGSISRIDASISEKLIEKVLAPKVGVERQLVKDVAEASSMQARYIESGMLRGRANINYFIFNFTGAVNSKELEEACQMLATIHPILRTAFVPHNRKVYQVVLKSFNVTFKRYMCPSWRLANVAEKILKKDQSSPVAFSAPMTKFMFLDGGKQSTLILRLSRAQYDDLSIALLVKDLKKLYDGSQNPTRRPSFCHFVRCAKLANSHGSEDYWRSLLMGSSITPIVNHDKPYQLTTSVRTLRQRLPVGSLANLGISFDTVLKAAWAMVLASLSGTNDVVFGEHIEGRHLRLSEGQAVGGVLGPTSNTVPVRVCFPDTPLSPLELLQYVHGQRIAGIPFENLGFMSIVEKCTPWPYWTRFSSVVQHQSEDTAILPTESKRFHLGAAACKFSILESSAQDISDMFVHSMMRGSERVELSLAFCENRVPVSFAEETLRMLCATVGLLTSVSMMQPIVPTASQYASLQKQIPLPQAPQPEQSRAQQQIQTVSPQGTLKIQTLISDAWTAVLEPQHLGVPEEHRHNAAFYDLWGSLIPAAQLASYLNKELPRLGVPGLGPAVNVSMEDVVENPTMLKQFELVARKMAEAGSGGRKLQRASQQHPEPTATPLSPVTAAAKGKTAAFGKSIKRLTSRVGVSPAVAAKTPISATTLALTALPPATAISPLTPTPVATTARSAVRESAPPLPRLFVPVHPDEGPRRFALDNHSRSRANSAEDAQQQQQPPRSRHSADGSLESMTEGSSVDDGEEPLMSPALPGGPQQQVVVVDPFEHIGGLRQMGRWEGDDLVSPLSPNGSRGKGGAAFGEGARRRASVFFGGLKMGA